MAPSYRMIPFATSGSDIYAGSETMASSSPPIMGSPGRPSAHPALCFLRPNYQSGARWGTSPGLRPGHSLFAGRGRTWTRAPHIQPGRSYTGIVYARFLPLFALACAAHASPQLRGRQRQALRTHHSGHGSIGPAQHRRQHRRHTCPHQQVFPQRLVRLAYQIKSYQYAGPSWMNYSATTSKPRCPKEASGARCRPCCKRCSPIA